MAAEPTAPDGAKDLTVLVGELQAAKFRIDTRQYLLAHELILALALEGEELLAAPAERVAACLGPIFCTSPEEQERFVGVVRQWRGEQRERTSAPGAKATPGPEPDPPFKSWRRLKWIDRAAVIIAPLLGVATIAAIYYLVPMRIEGTVTKDGPAGQSEPAPEAQLRLGGLSQTIKSDGSFSIEVARARSLPLEASLEGFQSIAINVTGDTTSPLPVHFLRAPTATPSLPTAPDAPSVSVYMVSLPVASSGRATRWDQVALGAIAAGVLAWFVLQAADRKRKELALMRMPEHDDGEQLTLQAAAPPAAGVNEQEIRRAAVAIRRLRDERALVLHVGGTIEATVRGAGFFSPHMVPRRTAPEYLMLVSEHGKEDHQARLFTNLFDAFEAQGVALDVYSFRDDPRTCLDDNGEGHLLARVISRHHRATLVVCAETSVAFNRSTGATAPWVETTKTLDTRVYVTPEPPFRWSALEFGLIEAGFVVLPASDAGWHRLGELGILDRPFESPEYARGFPAVIGGVDRRWLDRNEPEPDIVEKLLRQLQGYLGDEGFAWLCACAVYPEISWPLTLAVGKAPVNYALLPLLARLPWFRYAYMPDWLRLALVLRIAPDDEVRVRTTIEKLLEELAARRSASTDASASRLPISPFVGPLEVLRAAPPESALSDAILLGFVAKASLDPLMVRAPEALKERFRKRLGEFATSGQPSRPLGDRLLRRLRAWTLFYPARVRFAACVAVAVAAAFALPPLVTEARVSDSREPIWFINVPANDVRLTETAAGSALPALRVPELFLSRTEITVGQYRACVAEGQCRPADSRALDGPTDWPVRYVSVLEAVQYCAWLEQKLKTWIDTPALIAAALAGRSSDGRVWRVTLPSEPEWELAAKGTDGRPFPWGAATESFRANFNPTGLGTPSPVGTFLSGESPYRLLDMSGNVREWTRSAFMPYPYHAGRWS